MVTKIAKWEFMGKRENTSSESRSRHVLLSSIHCENIIPNSLERQRHEQRETLIMH